MHALLCSPLPLNIGLQPRDWLHLSTYWVLRQIHTVEGTHNGINIHSEFSPRYTYTYTFTLP